MNQKSKIIKSFTLIAILIWIGASIIRTSIGFSLYEVAEQFRFKENLMDGELYYTVKTFLNISFYVDVFYGVAFVLFTILLIINRNRIKKTGWLFMSVVLFYLFAIPEIFLIINDINMFYANAFSILKDNVISPQTKQLFDLRFSNDLLKIVLPMSFLSHLAIAFFLILKPLDKNES